MLNAVSPSTHVVSEDELNQYAAMGTIIHGMAQMALEGDVNPTHLYTDYSKEWDCVQNGSLQLKPSDANTQGFIEAHPEIHWHDARRMIEVEMFDDDMMLSGTADLFTLYYDKFATLDWKTSRSYSTEKKEKYFKQMALYSIMKEKQFNVKDKYLIIMPLNPHNKCGYGKAIVTDEVEKYKTLALEDLKTYNNLITQTR